MARAARLSIEMIRAAAWGQVTNATCLVLGRSMSATNRPLPATKRRSSRTRRAADTAGCRSALTLKLLGGVTPAYAIRRQRYCLYYLGIARAAAEIARNRFNDVVSCRVRIVGKQRVRREDHGRSAVTALQTVRFTEGILQRRQFA